MDQNPHVVFFYMIGCPHCERARPMWDQVKKDVPNGEKVLEIESANVPLELRSRVQGFPRFERTDVNGILIVEVEGAPMSADDLRSKLKLKKKSKSTRKGRRRTLRKRYSRRR